MTPAEAIAATAANNIIIDMKSKDKEGNLTEHLRIHPDGREEVIFRRKENQS